MSDRWLVVGFGVTGQALATRLPGVVTVVDDAPKAGALAAARAMGIDLVVAPEADRLASLVRDVAAVVVSPGVKPHHPVFAAARAASIPVVGELELAFERAQAPIVAITGTNGKTTVTTLVADMLAASGRLAIAAGNIGLPLIEAVEEDCDVLVVECSSAQLELTEAFAPHVGVWLNVSPDHFDWHPSMDAYATAKARIWRNQTSDDIAIANADDPVVRSHANGAPSQVRWFSLATGHSRASRVVDGFIQLDDGTVVVSTAELPRSLPHDLANAAAASTAAVAAGATPEACARVLRAFRGLPHRVALVGDSGAVRYYDDSKATTPASVLAAVEGFDSVVLIAGGRNKGLDLSVLASAADRVRAVVAIGDAADEVAGAFDGIRPVMRASTMSEAVSVASAAARPGDVVLLSPGCASYDWYTSYGERGDDFARAVEDLLTGARS
ncbi:MAG TPA: UDP-N-acetylmuramoyl-L-alanine--D-glutamate ligase [Acidimicrobiales bacterium]|nr:UDP-N-acetylmuramoyl-L-alanine--D-glutamate ligase [Acidimicrobiales bacterium]